MTFLEKLLEGGDSYAASANGNAVSVKPNGDSETALEAFQQTVDEILEHEGEGYSVFTTHISKDRPGNFTDLVVLRLDE